MSVFVCCVESATFVYVCYFFFFLSSCSPLDESAERNDNERGAGVSNARDERKRDIYMLYTLAALCALVSVYLYVCAIYIGI